MAVLEIKVDVDLQKLEAPEFDLGALLDQIGVLMMTQVQERFASGVGPDGPWAPLKAATIARKGSSAILVDTGNLRGSFSTESNAVDAVKLSSQVFYGVFHQFGPAYRHSTGRMMFPQRAFLGFGPQDTAEIGELVTNYLAAVFGG